MGVVDTLGDWFRVIVALSSLAVCILMLLRLLRVWRCYSLSQKMIFGAVFLYNANYIGRTTQLIIGENQSFNFWLLLVLMGNALMIVFLTEPYSSYEERFGMDMLHPTRHQR